MTSPDLIQADLHRMSWSQLAKAAEESTVHHDYARALILWRHAYHAGKRQRSTVLTLIYW